jgi:ABC-type antimicrobial peptide transport system permease subunit
LVDFYYRVSPPIAEFITEHPSLKLVVRTGLLPAVAMSAVAVNTSATEKIAIIGLLVLASVGLYAVVAYAVGRRTYEIGVRMAVGAQRKAILWLVLKQGLRLALIGIAVGLPLAFAG